MAGTFNYRFKTKETNDTCVVKFWFGTKYLVWKALNLKNSCKQVFRDLNYKLIKDLPPTDLFYNVVQHCKRSRVTVATVEILFASDDLNEILEFDRREIEIGAADPNCLNLAGEQYIPGWLKTAAQNKAPGAIKILSPIEEAVTSPEIISGVKEVVPEQKISVDDIDVSAAKEILRQMQQAKSLKNSGKLS